MSEVQIVSVIALLGFLVLAASELRSHRLGLKRGVVMTASWLAIFGIVVLSVDAIS